MDTLLKNLKKSESDQSHLGTSELLTRLINILAPRLHLQSGFKELSTTDPAFVREVLDCLKGDPREIEGFTAIDILHHAITKVINQRCSRQLDDVVHKVELDGLVLEKDDDMRSMLEQAIGLAKYLGKSSVVDSLFELLGDPIRLEAIRDDPVIKDVLNKILVMQNLTSKDKRKRQKLEKLQRYSIFNNQFSEDSQDEDDNSLKELIKICDALTRPPNHGTLKKSKSMANKSKSMITTVKDISMNAFMALKNTDEEKDVKWIQNFLSESLVEDIPWECSKALIILKEGYQAIIPREASRSILLGEASYTLIDDSGVEFYLSPKDKSNRKKQGLDVTTKKVTLVEAPEEDLDNLETKDYTKMTTNGSYFDNTTPMASNGTNGKNKITVSDEDIDDNDLMLDDYKPSKFLGKSRIPMTNFDSDEDDLDAEGVLSSLEKYRPSAYDAGPRDNSDINDIRDYYSNYKTRGFNRYSSASGAARYGQTSNVEPLDDFDYQPTPRYQRSSYLDSGSSNGGQFENYQQPQPLQPALDEPTKFLLEKSRAARNRPLWEPDVPDFERPQHQQQEQYFERPAPYESNLERPTPYEPSRLQRDPEDTMMTSKTRSLLDKVKESTMGLQDLNSMVDDFDDMKSQMKMSKTRKTSRFLKNPRDSMVSPNNGQNNDRSDYDAHRLADDILGENIHPPRERGEPDMGRKASLTSASGLGPTRKYSYQSSLNSGGSPEPVFRSRKTNNPEDDDLDAMLNDLKQKTSGRDMYKIVQDIEGGDQDDQNRVYGRKSVSPVPKSRTDLYATADTSVTSGPNRKYSYQSPGYGTDTADKYSTNRSSPVQSNYRQTSRGQVPGGSNGAGGQAPRPRYDPYETLRGGTGYDLPFERPQNGGSRDPTAASAGPIGSAAPPTSYGYPQQQSRGSQNYGYQQPPAASSMSYGDPYSSYGGATMPTSGGYMPTQQQVPLGYGGYSSQMQQQPQQPQQYMQASAPMYQSRMGRRMPPPSTYGYYE